MSFIDSPRTWKPRKWVFRVHFYVGLAIGLLMLVIGLSGAALVYSHEIEVGPRWSDGPVAGRLPLEALSGRILAAHPGFDVRDIRLDTAGNATHFHLQRPDGEPKAKGRTLHLVVDPRTGAVLKAVDRREGVWNWLRELHHNLLAGKNGRVANGIVALLLLALCLTGIVMWWPGRKTWRKRLGIQPGTGWKRFNWDLHNAAGFWIAVPLAFFAFTALQFAFPDAFKGAIRRVTASPRPVEKPPAARRGAPAPVDRLIASAQAAIPEGRVSQIKFPKRPDEPFEIRVKTAFDGHHEGNNKIFVDGVTAEAIRMERFDDLSMGNRLIAVLGGLHTGRFMTPGWTSMALRSLWVIVGLAPGFLFLTGFLMWWNRVAVKRLRALSAGRPAPARDLARTAGAVFCMLAAGGQLWGQASFVRGRVLDGSGATVAGAKVTLQTSPERVVRTGDDGAFEFAPLTPGAYTITVEAPGFELAAFQARTGATEQVALSPAPLTQMVVVNAGTFDQIRLDEPVFQAGLTRSDISTRNNRRLSDVVARMPGVFMTGPPGGDKDVRLRGLDKEFSRTQVDGIAIPDGGEKRELQLNRIPSSVVESVRIIRNPTAEFESDGLAGRVDVQTRPIPDDLRVDARAGYGGRDDSLANPISQGQLSGGMRFHRNFGFFGTFDYLKDTLPIGRDKLLANRDVESESERQRQRSPNFFGGFGVYTQRFGDLHLKPVAMNFATSNSKLKQTHNAAGRLTKREEEAEEKAQRTLGMSLNHRIARSSGLILDSQAAWFRSTESKDKWKLGYKVAGDGAYTPDKRTLEPEAKRDQTRSGSMAASLPLRTDFWHDLKFGGNVRLRHRFRDKDRFEVNPNGTSRYTGESKDRYRLAEDYFAAFIQDRVRITDRISITPGVRFERVRLLTASATEQALPRYFDDWNPSAVLLYRVTGNMSLRAAASRALSRPKFDELSPFENVSATKVVIGNPDLDPARAWNYDAGFD